MNEKYIGRLGLGPGNDDLFAGARVMRCLDRFSIHAHVAILNESLKGAAGGVREFFLKELVQPRLGLGYLHPQCFAPVHCSSEGSGSIFSRVDSRYHIAPPAIRRRMLMPWPEVNVPSHRLPRLSARKNSMAKRSTA